MASNIINQKMINYRVYIDGEDILGMADVQLPSIESMTESIKGAGIAGEYDAPTLGHFSAMSLTLNWRTLEKNLVRLGVGQAIKLDMRGSIQVYDPGTGELKSYGVKVFVVGTPKKLDLGKLVVAATTDSSTELSVSYIKVEIDGKKEIEIDQMNFKAFINGVDILAAIRQQLGL